MREIIEDALIFMFLGCTLVGILLLGGFTIHNRIQNLKICTAANGVLVGETCIDEAVVIFR